MKTLDERYIDKMLDDEETAPGFIAQYANDPEMFKTLMQLYLLKQLASSRREKGRDERKG